MVGVDLFDMVIPPLKGDDGFGDGAIRDTGEVVCLIL